MKARHALSLAAAGTLGATILITLAGGTAASSKAPAASSTLAASWRWPGADPQNDRDVGGPINVVRCKTVDLLVPAQSGDRAFEIDGVPEHDGRGDQI